MASERFPFAHAIDASFWCREPEVEEVEFVAGFFSSRIHGAKVRLASVDSNAMFFRWPASNAVTARLYCFPVGQVGNRSELWK